MIPNDYCTIAEVKQAMPDKTATLFIDPNGDPITIYDAFLTELCTRVSRYIDRITKRIPGAYYVTTETTKYFDGVPWVEYGISSNQIADALIYRNGFINAPSLAIDELADDPSLVAVNINGDLVTYIPYTPVTDYIMWPYNAKDEFRPYMRIYLNTITGQYQSWYGFRKGVKITGYFGYSKAVPDDIKQACIIQVVKWFRRGQQLYQDIGVQTDPQQLIYKIMSDDFSNIAASYRKLII
jgi:hypothetical protein